MGYYGNERNEQIIEGWTIVLRERHLGGTDVYSHSDIDDAYSCWVEQDGHVQEWASINELITEIYDDDEDTPERKAEVANTILGHGIKDGQPFLAFNASSSDTLNLAMTDYLPIDTPKEDMVKEVARDDAKRAEIWEAKAGETYGEFIGRILRGTSCYSLTKSELYNALRVDEWSGEDEEELG